MNDKVEICKLFENRDKKGNVYLKGNLTKTTKLLVLQTNKLDTGEKVYSVFIAEKLKSSDRNNN